MSGDKSVLLILCEYISYKYSAPWIRTPKEYGSGSGFYVKIHGYLKGENYVLTNAHVVQSAISITAKKYGDPNLYELKIEAIIYECDMAVLTGPKELWEGMEPLDLEHKASNKIDEVYVYGFPQGGDNISITKGIISRMEMINYYENVQGITWQVDAAINPGNSGGPVLDKDGNLVGITFAKAHKSENMGYVIPLVLVKFVISVLQKEKKFTRLCQFKFRVQEYNNDNIADYIGIPLDDDRLEGKYGILVVIGDGELEEHDIIFKINGIPIMNDGYILLSDLLGVETSNNIVRYTTIASLGMKDDTVDIELIRKGKTKKIKYKLNYYSHAYPILPNHIKPQYVILCGLVFLQNSKMLYNEKRLEGKSGGLTDEYRVVLSDKFQHKCNSTFPNASYLNYILLKVNNVNIETLEQLYHTVIKNIKAKKIIQFEFQDYYGICILRKEDIDKYHEQILNDVIGIKDDHILT